MTRDKLKNGRLVAVFLIGLVMFNYPLLSLFNMDTLFMGIPLFYVYLFAAWLSIILLTSWITKERP